MRTQKTLPWLVLFLLTASLNLIAQGFDIPFLANASKPGLMILLGIYFFNSVEKSTLPFIKLALYALFFSWIGDVLLIFENLFVFGLSFFLVAQVFYVLCYHKAVVRVEDNKVTFVRRLFWTITLLFYGLVLFYYMQPHLGELRYPVFMYCISLILMGIFAVQRNGKTSAFSYSLVLSGALLFIISDSMIGLNIAGLMERKGFYIMLTYILAQWFIVEGLILHYRFSKSLEEA
jgi:uncharacterized membrane protein YhhN